MKADDKQQPTPVEVAEMMELASLFGLSCTYDQARRFILKNLKGEQSDDKQRAKATDQDSGE